MKKTTSALAVFALLATMAFLPATATAKAPKLSASSKSQLFNNMSQCIVEGYAYNHPNYTTGVTGVKIRVTNQSTFAYYEVYTDYYGYYQGGIDVGYYWHVQVIDGTPTSAYDWHLPNSTDNAYVGVTCSYGPGEYIFLPFVTD